MSEMSNFAPSETGEKLGSRRSTANSVLKINKARPRPKSPSKRKRFPRKKCTPKPPLIPHPKQQTKRLEEKFDKEKLTLKGKLEEALEKLEHAKHEKEAERKLLTEERDLFGEEKLALLAKVDGLKQAVEQLQEKFGREREDLRRGFARELEAKDEACRESERALQRGFEEKLRTQVEANIEKEREIEADWKELLAEEKKKLGGRIEELWGGTLRFVAVCILRGNPFSF